MSQMYIGYMLCAGLILAAVYETWRGFR
jgi:hypothetical protein